jgi:hypothetical protein
MKRIMVQPSVYAVFCVFFTLAVLVPNAAQAQSDHLPVDVVIVLDSSGSMRANDPDFLRVPAAQMLIRLLRGEDRAAVVSFSDKAWPIRRLSPVATATQRDGLSESVNQVSNRGMHTNLHAAVSGAVELINDSPGSQRKVMVFMTDGVMDVGDAEQDMVLREAMLNDLAPALEQQGIELFSIAFTDASDQALLNQVSEAGDGRAFLARTAEDLPPVFQAIFEQIKEPEALPVSEGGFLVDAAVEEMTVIIPMGGETALLQPDGERIDQGASAEGLRWYQNPAYTMVTVQAPMAGQWQIEAGQANASDVYILTDLQMDLDWPATTTTGEQEMITAWLSEGGYLVNDNRIDPFQLSARLGDGDWQAMNETQEVGVFDWPVRALEPGYSSVTVRAIAPTVQRQKTIRIKAEGMAIKAEQTPANMAPSSSPAEPVTAGDDVPVDALITDTSSDAQRASETPPQWRVWLFRSIAFVLINAVLVAGLLWWRRRRAAEPAVELDGLEPGDTEGMNGNA